MRRIQFAKKALWGSVGLTGIAIILLTVGFLGGFIQGLLELVLNHPIIAGFIPGFGLIPLIHSSKQKIILIGYDEIAHSDFSGTSDVTQSTMSMPVAGWAHKVTTTIFQETAFDQDILCATAWHKDAESRRWEMGTGNQNVMQYMTEHWDADSVTEQQTTFPVQVFFVESSVTDNDEGALRVTQKYGGPGRFYEQGEQISFTSSTRDRFTAPTTGNLNIKSELTVIVAAFDSKGQPHDEVAPFVTINGDGLGSTNMGFSWPAHTDMRIANLHVTLWNGLDTDNRGWVSLSKNADEYGIAVNTVELHNRAWLLLTGELQDSISGADESTITRGYARGPFYLHKGESLQMRADEMNSYFTIQFQYIPNYEHTSEFRVRSEASDVSNDQLDSQFLAMFQLPYDMFVTSVEGFFQLTTDSESDAISEVHLVGIKSQNLLDSNDLLIGYANADVEGRILGADNQSGAHPWTLKTIPITIDGDDTTAHTTAFIAKFAEAIADYYPAGALIGIWVPSDITNNINTLNISMNIEGLNRIKTSKVGTNVLEGNTVSPLGVN